ncbi:Ig domain-containing protein, partial [Clostridium sp. CF012]|uniref:Ig-like domain-containing protein n=1 Tax=Clostridium sp. CF012 TaxID=2843319 RepID=UPI001C0D1329
MKKKSFIIFILLLMISLIGVRVNVFAADQYSNTVVPIMTGYTTNGVTVSASSEHSTDYAWKAFDGGSSSGHQWSTYYSPNPLVTNTSGWIKVDFGASKKIEKYTMRCLYEKQAPKSWTFEGSQDGASWTVLDTRANEVNWTNVKREYTFSNENQYKYYKLNVSANNGYYGNIIVCEIELMKKIPSISASSIELDKAATTLIVGNTTTLNASILPVDAANKNVNWISSDETIATVDATGKVTAIKAGTATVTATTQDGSNLSAGCIVTVTNPGIIATELTLDKTNLALTVGNSGQLVATIKPSNATTGSAIWTSSNPTIATVDATGKVTAIKVGTATVIATTQDGSNLSASCIVTVTDKVVQPPTDNTGNAILTITM